MAKFRVCVLPPWFTAEQIANRICGDGSHAHVWRSEAVGMVLDQEAEYVGERAVRRLNFRKNLRDKSIKLGPYLARCVEICKRKLRNEKPLNRREDWALA